MKINKGTPFLVLNNYDLNVDIVKLIPKRLAKKFKMIAIDKIETILVVAIADTKDPYTPIGVLYAENRSKHDIQVVYAKKEEILNAIKRYYGRSR